MLSVAKVRRGHEAYYLEATAASSPGCPGLVEPDGAWWGGLAEVLGLAGRTVEAAQLSTLLAGADPTTRAPLDPRHDRVKVTAFDCTFAAPKSVSLLHALAPPDATAEVRRSHEQAVAGALGYLERHAAHVRRDGALSRAGGLAAASFLHRTSRADDPHLHTHLVVANLAPDADGRWSALDARPLFAHAAAAGALYRAQLRYEISRRLSVAWQARAEGFADLVGIPAAALRGFSRRSSEIAAELARTGWAGSHSARFAADRTRPDKDRREDYPTLVAAWRERAYALGVSRSTVAGLGLRATRATGHVGEDRSDLEDRVADAAESLGRSFDRRELVRATCARLSDGAPVERVEVAVDARLDSGELVRCGERAVQLRALGGGRIPGGLVEARFATKEIAALGSRLQTAMESAPALDARAGDRGCTYGERLLSPGVVVAGREGDEVLAYMVLREAALAVHSRGRQVVGLAPDRRAAAHLEAATGIATTVLDAREPLGGGAAVVVAHPDRCPLRVLVPLVERARASDMTVVLLAGHVRSGGTPAAAPGDSTRLPAVGHGTGGALARYTVAGVEVVLASDLVLAFDGIRQLAGASRSDGRRPLVVTAEPRGLASLGIEIACPRDALRRQRAENLDLIVFGGARILGPGIARVPDDARSHVAVAPVERDLRGDRPFVLELAEPSGLRRELGRTPDGRRDRDAWRTRAIESERQIRWHRIEPGRGQDEIAWARGTRVIDRSRRLERTLSR
ncbi:MAG: MobF family relaxase [Acidimicrobiales bacterium]